VVLDPEFSQTGFVAVPDRGGEEGCTASQSVFNLANTIVGAGVMALPRVVAELGLLLGVGAICACAAISVFALESIVWEAEATRQTVSYGALVESQFGRWGGASMQLAIIVNNFGIMIVYLIIASDVLVGSGEIKGVLPAVFGTLSGAEAPWFFSKAFVLCALAALGLLPLVCLRSLRKLSVASMASIGIAIAFSITTAAIAVTATARGVEADVTLLPDERLLGDTPARMARNTLQALPVVLTSYNCHFNVHSIMNELRGYTRARMSYVVRAAVGICCLMYVAVGAGAYLLFGEGTTADVLASYGREKLGPALGDRGALVTATVAKTLYTATLVVTFPMINWALRINAFELGWGRTPDPGSFPWYAATGVLLVLALLAAITIPSIFVAIELTGATAGVLIAFFWPMTLLLKIKRDRGELTWGTGLVAGGVLTLGLLVAVVGTWEAVDTMRGKSSHG